MKRTMTQSLYERLGGAPAIAAIARDIVALHRKNPLIRTRFEVVDVEALETHVRTFIGAGTGGPEAYEGRDMPSAHKGMNLNERELVAAIDDVLLALRNNGVGEGEQNEMLAILYSLKDEVLFK
jgi:hemoglobin